MKQALALTLAAALLPAAASAQVTLTPRALGTGGAYVGLARGHDALFQNPANLGLRGNPFWSIAVPQLGATGVFTGISAGELFEARETNDLPQARRDEILGGVPAAGITASSDLRVPVFAMQQGRFVLGVGYGAIVRQGLGRDIVDLVLNGYQDGRTDYSVGNTTGERATFLDFAAAYGHRIGPVSLGVTGHYLRGRTRARSRLFEPRFDLEQRDLELEYREVLAHGGQGWAVDVGAAAEPVRGLVVSAAVANLAGEMTWNDELHTRHLVLQRADFNVSDPRMLTTRLRMSEEKVDVAAASVTTQETARGLFDESFFPATLRAGAAYTTPGGRTSLTTAYQGALTTGRFDGGWRRQLGAGVEQKVLPILTLRAGAASNLDGGRMLTGGVSLGPLNLGLGHVSGSAGAGGPEQSGWVATFGLSARTTGTRP